MTGRRPPRELSVAETAMRGRDWLPVLFAVLDFGAALSNPVITGKSMAKASQLIMVRTATLSVWCMLTSDRLSIVRLSLICGRYTPRMRSRGTRVSARIGPSMIMSGMTGTEDLTPFLPGPHLAVPRHFPGICLAGLDFALLMVEEADHVVFEGIAALIVAETLLMPRIDGVQGGYPGTRWRNCCRSFQTDRSRCRSRS